VAADRRALVVHPGALGDVLQAVPALRTIGHGARVTFCGQPRLGALLSGAGVVDEAVSFDGFGLDALFSRDPAPAAIVERLGRFQEIVSWFGSRDARYVEQLRAVAPGCVVAPPQPAADGTPDRAILLDPADADLGVEGGAHRDGPAPATAPMTSRSRTVWEHLLATVAPLRPTCRADLAAMEMPESWRAGALRALQEHGLSATRPVLVVHPGSGGAWKLAPPELLARAISPLVQPAGVQVLVHAGPADREAADRLIRLLDSPAPVLIEPPLTLLAAVLSLAAGYLGGDSGVSHLAAAVGAPAIILFPPATLERWAPWSSSARPIAMEGDPAAVATAATAALAQATSAWRSPGP
jgi:ADP-heptose:LPS heptosyltransferase